MLEHSRFPSQALDISQVQCSEVNEFLYISHAVILRNVDFKTAPAQSSRARGFAEKQKSRQTANQARVSNLVLSTDFIQQFVAFLCLRITVQNSDHPAPLREGIEHAVMLGRWGAFE